MPPRKKGTNPNGNKSDKNFQDFKKHLEETAKIEAELNEIYEERSKNFAMFGKSQEDIKNILEKNIYIEKLAREIKKDSNRLTNDQKKELLQTQKEIVMLLAVLVKRGTLQSTLIQEMGSVGFAPKRIAELLETSSNNVSVSLHNARKNKK